MARGALIRHISACCTVLIAESASSILYKAAFGTFVYASSIKQHKCVNFAYRTTRARVCTVETISSYLKCPLNRKEGTDFDRAFHFRCKQYTCLECQHKCRMKIGSLAFRFI